MLLDGLINQKKEGQNMLQVNKNLAIEIVDDRNITVMHYAPVYVPVIDLNKKPVKEDVIIDGKKVKRSIKRIDRYEWRTFGSYGRSIKAVVHGLLTAGVMTSEVESLNELIDRQEQLIKSIDIDAISKYIHDDVVASLNEKIKKLSSQLSQEKEKVNA